jgi:dihydrofolate reductase
MNGMPKYVVSSTMKDAQWNNSKVIRSNAVEDVAGMRSMPGDNILVAGSGQLVRTLVENDLVDEYRLMVYPIVLGAGKRLFQDGNQKRPLRLVESKPIGSGILILVYHPDRKS